MKNPQTSPDLVRAYLREIGRVPLLTHEQEILYGKQVQRSMACQDVKDTLTAQLAREPNLAEWAAQLQLSESELRRAIAEGELAKRKMVEANLRLVVSVAKKIYEAQHGSVGFNPGRFHWYAAGGGKI